jgi:hypothetical protein
VGMSRPEIEFDEAKHRYTINGEIYPSVTTIISATVPKDLSWWGMRVGVTGVHILAQRGRLPIPIPQPDHLEELLKQERLTTNNIFRDRGDSGISIHKAFENYGISGEVPEPDNFPHFDRGRIRSLAQWLLDNRPVFIANETQTASVEHKYAGTYDALITFEAGDYKGKTAIVDLKTSKYVYPESHFPQLEAYREAEREAGEDPGDCGLILHLPESDPATLHRSLDTFDDFRVLLEHYKAVLARRERLKQFKRAEKRRLKELA